MTTKENESVTHLVVDMLYDFIDGKLACINGEEAVESAVNYINEHPLDRVVYICDSHPKNHCSFTENGGIWPPHCVEGSKGASIHDMFFTLKRVDNRPNSKNIYRKGYLADKEQYSGYFSVGENSNELNSILGKNIVISGIATEFCVRETTLDLLRGGYNVTINSKALAFVTREGHENTLKELAGMGVSIL